VPYLDLFDRAANHVKQLGVDVEFRRGPILPAGRIDELCAPSVIPVPKSLAAFYLEVGDGLFFSWDVDGQSKMYGFVEFPPLAELIVTSFDVIKWRTEWKDSFDFHGTKDPRLAKQTALRMRRWLRFYDEGNGDAKCLDTAVDPAPVVFNQHDWFDGGTGENGHVLGPSLFEFLTDWSKVCFQEPEGNWWPSVFRRPGGVDWTSPEFREPFRIPMSS
jgi:hypothetical protein